MIKRKLISLSLLVLLAGCQKELTLSQRAICTYEKGGIKAETIFEHDGVNVITQTNHNPVSYTHLFDQKRLEILANYDPKLTRQELAVTGRIPAGSSLMVLELKTLQDGTELPPGTYTAIKMCIRDRRLHIP